MTLKNLLGVVGAALLILTSVSASAQIVPQTIWSEKWPVDVKIIPTNAVSIYLRANFGKIGEAVGGALDKLLADPKLQAKVAPAAAKAMKNLFADTSKNDNDKAKTLYAAIDADIGPYVSAPVGNFGVVAGFSGSYNTVRLSWTRQIQRLSCQKQKCTCPNGQVVDPLYQCYVYDPYRGTYPVYPSCTISTDTVDNEAEYKIYRNDKLLAVYGEARKVASIGASWSGTFGFIDFSLKGTIDAPLVNSSEKAGPFYDLDPYNTPTGTAIGYRIDANFTGCGNGYNNIYTGWGIRQSSLILDADGDSRPDFYPADVLAQKRAFTGQMPGMPGDPVSVPPPSQTVSRFTINQVSDDGTTTIWTVKNGGTAPAVLSALGLTSTYGSYPSNTTVASSTCGIGSTVPAGGICTVSTTNGGWCNGNWPYWLTATNSAGTSQGDYASRINDYSCGASAEPIDDLMIATGVRELALSSPVRL